MNTVKNVSALGVFLCLGAWGWASRIEARRTLSNPELSTSNQSQSASSGQKEQKEGATQQPADFSVRCKAPGVLVCQGFDSPEIGIAAKWPASGLYPAGDNLIHGSFTSGQRASGAGSLHFEILTHTGANAAGFWRQSFGKSFGEGTTFYVQFRQRFTEQMLHNNWGDTTWKQVIFHNHGSTCSDVELTTAQYYNTGIPYMYTDCGSRHLTTNNSNPPYLFHQGDYKCWYGHLNTKDCFMYPTNQWVTFYYQVSIGHWGIADSEINAWVAFDGKPMKQWIKMPRFKLNNDHPGQDYDSVTLLTYMTGKDPGRDLPTADTWYDDLIVSTEPIAPPTPAVVP
jgi:hypothetical protein